MSNIDTDYSLTDDVKKLAISYWQDSLAKFFPTSKGPTETERSMFEAGYKIAAIRGAEHHIEVTDKLFNKNTRLRAILQRMVNSEVVKNALIESYSEVLADAYDALERK